MSRSYIATACYFRYSRYSQAATDSEVSMKRPQRTPHVYRPSFQVTDRTVESLILDRLSAQHMMLT
jgi:hypothetical protein